MSGSYESVHRSVITNGMAGGAANGTRQLAALDPEEALRLLASVEYGRVVFTQDALPAIRPVNHLIDNGTIVIRTRLSAKMATALDFLPPTVVAYEADLIDASTRLGWSVVATGYARPVTDPDDHGRLQTVLVPWVNMSMDTIIRITPQIVSGFRLVEPDELTDAGGDH